MGCKGRAVSMSVVLGRPQHREYMRNACSSGWLSCHWDRTYGSADPPFMSELQKSFAYPPWGTHRREARMSISSSLCASWTTSSEHRIPKESARGPGFSLFPLWALVSSYVNSGLGAHGRLWWLQRKFSWVTLYLAMRREVESSEGWPCNQNPGCYWRAKRRQVLCLLLTSACLFLLHHACEYVSDFPSWHMPAGTF